MNQRARQEVRRPGRDWPSGSCYIVTENRDQQAYSATFGPKHNGHRQSRGPLRSLLVLAGPELDFLLLLFVFRFLLLAAAAPAGPAESFHLQLERLPGHLFP